MNSHIASTKSKVHLDLELEYGSFFIACYYTHWKNQGDIPMPNWEYTTKYHEVTCKRCLGMIRMGLRSID